MITQGFMTQRQKIGLHTIAKLNNQQMIDKMFLKVNLLATHERQKLNDGDPKEIRELDDLRFSGKFPREINYFLFPEVSKYFQRTFKFPEISSNVTTLQK